MSISAVASRYVPILSGWARHGKTRRRDDHQDALWSRLDNMTVPKSWFLHFYLVGLLMWWLIVCVVVATTHHANFATTSGWWCANAMLGMHLLRRCYECVCVHQFGNGRMHIVGYAVGMLHYCILPWNFVPPSHPHHATHVSEPFLWALGVLLCLWGQYEQHEHHVILAKLRTRDGNYSIPYGPWFYYVSCPHYLAEILIYIAFCVLLLPNVSTWALLVWVVSNLTVSAFNSHEWYLATFGDEYAKLRRKALFPYVA